MNPVQPPSSNSSFAGSSEAPVEKKDDGGTGQMQPSGRRNGQAREVPEYLAAKAGKSMELDEESLPESELQCSLLCDVPDSGKVLGRDNV